jgi:hypothetical protein
MTTKEGSQLLIVAGSEEGFGSKAAPGSNLTLVLAHCVPQASNLTSLSFAFFICLYKMEAVLLGTNDQKLGGSKQPVFVLSQF